METKAEVGQSWSQGGFVVQQIRLGILFGTRGHLQLPLPVKQEEHLGSRAQQGRAVVQKGKCVGPPSSSVRVTLKQRKISF